MTLQRPVVGLIGAGGISHVHLPALQRLAQEVLIYSEEGAAELAALYGGIVVDSLGELLDRADVVDVVTPTFTHHDLVLRAIRAGKHVVSEKPLSRTDADAAELVESARASGVRLYPAHVVRYMPEYALLKRVVDDGQLGDLAVLRFVRSGAFPDRAWFADPELSGGIIMDQMIHDLDIARWVAGEVASVSAISHRAGTAEHPVEAAHVTLTHTSGAITQCSGIWGPSHLPFTTEYSVTGNLGSLSHSSRAERNFIAELADNDAMSGFLPEVDPAENPYFLELQSFLEAIAGGETPRVSAEDGLAAVRIANAALDSLHTGQPVALAPTLAEVR